MEQKSYSLPQDFILRDRYRIIKVLGQGGFGITYLAHDNFLDAQVCIKELFISGSSTRGENNTVHSQSLGEFSFQDFKERFLDEAKKLAKFNHPYIVKVIDILEANNTAYFVMEYAEGPTLKEKVKQDGAFTMQQALPIMEKLLDAVDEVHRNGMLHRDIKPDNIILKPNSDIILIDFGSARNYGEGKTITQTALLTPGFAPIEQYNPKAKRSAATDIYALGATLYYMLTGEKPLAATERVTETMPAPHKLNSNITTQVSSAIMLAMELKAEDRFQSIKDLKAALKDVASSEEVINEKLAVQEEEAEKSKYNRKSFSNFFGSFFGISPWWIRTALVFCVLVLSFIHSINPYDYIWMILYSSLIVIYLTGNLIINWKRTLMIFISLIALLVYVLFFTDSL
jgi:serine/threonine protein kinase